MTENTHFSKESECPILKPCENGYMLLRDWKTNCGGMLSYSILIPAGFVSDGSSIHWLASKVFGSPTNPKIIRATIVHDYLYRNGSSRELHKTADMIYRDYKISLGINRFCASKEYETLRIIDILRFKRQKRSKL